MIACNHLTAEGATAAGNSQAPGPLGFKTLESGPYRERPRRRSKPVSIRT